MSRMLAAAATALSLIVASPALAGPEDTPAPAPAAQPADAATRAAAERADALSRSIFWTREAQINPMDPVAAVKAARALREMGQPDQAIEAVETMLLVQPGNVEAMLEVGRGHIARGQAFYGIARLEQARDLAPGDWRPLSLLGVAYQQVKRPDDARAAWNSGLALSPDNATILSNAAMSQVANGDAVGAEALLRRAVEQPDATLQMKLNLALVLGLLGKSGEAEGILRRALPPDQAEQNLKWLRDQTGGASAGADRTWDSIRTGG